MSQRRKLAVFVVLAYALSWLAWAPLWLAALRGMDTRPSPYWHLAGGLGPLLAAVLVSTRDRDARARLVLPRLVGRANLSSRARVTEGP